jgi:hypothetical protein
MDGATLYDDDILAWSEQQAAALRSLAGRHDLPNQLDLANVVEEIEDVGKSEFRAVESLIGNILVHLILLSADPDTPSIRGWRGEITAWRLAVRRRISHSMRTKIGMDEIWQDAVTLAYAKLADWDIEKAEHTKTTLTGTACPFDVGTFCSETFDIPEAVEKLPPA